MKKRFITYLLFAASISVLPVFYSYAQTVTVSFEKADVNGDNRVDISDVVAVINFMVVLMMLQLKKGTVLTLTIPTSLTWVLPANGLVVMSVLLLLGNMVVTTPGVRQRRNPPTIGVPTFTATAVMRLVTTSAATLLALTTTSPTCSGAEVGIYRDC